MKKIIKINILRLKIKYFLVWLNWRTIGKISYWKTKILYGYCDETTAPMVYKTFKYFLKVSKELNNKNI